MMIVDDIFTSKFGSSWYNSWEFREGERETRRTKGAKREI